MGAGCSGAQKQRTKGFTIITNKAFKMDMGIGAGTSSSEVEAGGYFTLTRGGYLVETDTVGNIQFGIPPETIKDSLSMGLSVPHYFVLPHSGSLRFDLFDRRTGLSKAEFEFPIYFNFFVKKRRVVIITNEETEAAIKTAFQETLLGPEWLRDQPEKIRQDYPQGTPDDKLPNVFQEGVKLDRSRLTMHLTSMLEFMFFDPTKGVMITPSPDNLEATGKCVSIKPKSKLVDMKLQYHYEVKGAKGKSDIQIPMTWELGSVYNKSPDIGRPFNIPIFGITFLGVSHGFDAQGPTTGFVIWMNRQGIMVDPPPYTHEVLDQMGIPHSAIESVILTHCHADHDAGTFQKILLTKKINFFTTKTIRDSFIRKYAAITGFPIDFLNSLYQFHPVTIGEPISFYEGFLTFHYSLHTIPCIGFVAKFLGKSMIYSADTHTNPDLQFEDSVGAARAEELRKFDWNHTVVLHEMGVPPIHTPLEQLLAACKAHQNTAGRCPLRDRLFILHTRQGDAEKHGLLQAHKYDTIQIDVEVQNATEHMELIGLLSSVLWLKPVARNESESIKHLAENKKVIPNKVIEGAGKVIHEEDAMLDCIQIVRAGLAMKKVGDEETRLQVGSCIGMHGLLEEMRQPGSSRSLKLGYKVENSVGSGDEHNLTLLEIPYATVIEFLDELGGNFRAEVEELLKKTLEEDLDPAAAALKRCPVLNNVLEEQMSKSDFRQMMKRHTFKKGEQLQVQSGRPAEYAFLIAEGRVLVALDDSYQTMGARTFRGVGQSSLEPHEVGGGTFIADINALQKSEVTMLLIEAVTDVICWRIEKKDICFFFENFPGVLFQMLDLFTMPALSPEKYPHDPARGLDGHVKRDLTPPDSLDSLS